MRVRKGVASAETTIKNFEAEVGKPLPLTPTTLQPYP